MHQLIIDVCLGLMLLLMLLAMIMWQVSADMRSAKYSYWAAAFVSLNGVISFIAMVTTMVPYEPSPPRMMPMMDRWYYWVPIVIICILMRRVSLGQAKLYERTTLGGEIGRAHV